jgi:hypothetical protein
VRIRPVSTNRQLELLEHESTGPRDHAVASRRDLVAEDREVVVVLEVELRFAQRFVPAALAVPPLQHDVIGEIGVAADANRDRQGARKVHLRPARFAGRERHRLARQDEVGREDVEIEHVALGSDAPANRAGRLVPHFVSQRRYEQVESLRDPRRAVHGHSHVQFERPGQDDSHRFRVSRVRSPVAAEDLRGAVEGIGVDA